MSSQVETEASPEWIAVDWGTSNLRVWGMTTDGTVTGSADSDEGMGRLAPDAFAGVLTELIAAHIADPSEPRDVVVCGMAGARQGWLEAAYLEVPGDLSELGHRAVSPTLPGTALKARILPGVCHPAKGAEDVMRGEETQLLGFARLNPGYRGVVCMPGTHSKWVHLDGLAIKDFTTVMTGELYEVLGHNTVLRHSLSGAGTGPNHAGGFSAGLEQAFARPEYLTALLFKVRAASLLSGRDADWCAGYLSGLLVGAEIAGQKDMLGAQPIPLIGSRSLVALYDEALGMLGKTSRTVDATQATLTGLAAARQQMKE